MEVEDALPGVRPNIEHQPVAAIGQPFFPGDAVRGAKEGGEQLGIERVRFIDAADVVARNHQDVRRRLGMDVAESDDLIVLIDDLSWDLARRDAAERALGDGVLGWARG